MTTESTVVISESEMINATRRKPAIVRIVWALALVGITLGSIDGAVSLQLAESAPQQAAAAGMACFYLIGAYTFARAVQELAGR
jgi:hypothetical protein